jgi:2-polyprenyl-3-methyl-5-hydroxy-6-metoxy-1,4-benzoquinol methylase
MNEKYALPNELCLTCNEGVPEFAFNRGAYRLYQCPSCGFLFVHPFPRDDQIVAFYNDGYQRASAEFYPKAKSRARRALGKGLQLLRYVHRKSVLDIGCGGGFMVNAFARLGAQASGLDISAGAIAYAHRHFPHCQFYCESLRDFGARGLRFDFVFSTEVFEHLAGPSEFMATLDAVTRPGSRVYIGTPDSGHATVPADLSLWDQV